MNKSKILVLIPSILLAFILILSFSGIDAEVTDPWYKAIQKIQNSQKLNQTDPDKARKLLEEGGNELKALSEKHPYHARIHYLLSYYYLNTGQYDLAFNSSYKAIEIGAGGLVNQVEFEAEKIAVQAAVNSINQINSRSGKLKKLWEYRSKIPNNTNLMLLGAQLHTNVNQLDSAMVYYENVLKIDKKNKNALENYAKLTFFYGNNLVKENKFELAYQFYKLAQQSVPNNADYNNNLGNVALKINKAKEAVKYFQNAVNLNPSNSVYKGNLQLAQKIASGEAS